MAINRFRDRALLSSDGLVYQCMLRPAGEDAGGDLPVIVLSGPRGSGKTEMLTEIADRCRPIPHARLDFGTAERLTTRDVLISLWSQLGTRCGQFGRIRFPRLLLGLLVHDNAIDTRDADAARDEIERLVTTHRLVTGPGSVDALSPAELSLDLKVSLPVATAGIKIPLRTFTRPIRWARSRSRVRLHFAGALAWYARNHRGDGYEALVDLKRTSEEDWDRLLCDAFVADLVDAYSGDRLASHRTLRCVALLDNVDRDGGAAFLDHLAATAHRLAPAVAVPLVVVAARRQAAHRVVPEETVASSPSVLDGRPYTIRLRGLSRDEIDDIAREEVGNVPGLARLVDCLTGGHPWTVELLIAAVAHRRREDPGARSVRDVLDLPPPSVEDGDGPETVSQHALRHLLANVPAGVVRRLVTWSAAHDMGEMVRMDTLRSPRAAGMQRLNEAIPDWTDTVDGKQVLHPLLRRLLLHELAVRPADDALRWEAVHEQLRMDYEKRLQLRPADERELDELRTRVPYHELALGRLGPVVAHLRHLLVTSDVPAWLERLATIAAAPCLPFPGAPVDRVAGLVAAACAAGDVGEDEIDRTIAELLVSRWISSDPLGDPELTLVPIIRHQYQRLADYAITTLARPVFMALYEEAEAWQDGLRDGPCT